MLPATSEASASGGRARVVAIDGEPALDELVHDLLDPQRRRPVVVVSVPSHRDEPYIDAAALAREADGQADVCVVPTGPLTFRMADALGSMACVYGGAGRLYAPGTAWLRDPFSSKLRFARDEAEGARATEELVADVLGALFTGTTTLGARAGVASREASGRVSTLVPPSRALVTLEDGEVASIWSDVALSALPIERLVTVGMGVAGILEVGTRRLDVTGMRTPPEEALAAYDAGAVVLVRVAQLQPDRVDVELHPGVTAVLAVADVTANERDDLTELMSPGEAVAARVSRRGSAEGGWTLTMVDVDDEEPILASPPLLRGGPPWLDLADSGERGSSGEPVEQGRPAGPVERGRSGEPVAAATSLPAAPTTATSAPAGDVAALRLQVQQLTDENALLEAQRTDYLTKIRSLQTEVERLRTRVREAKAKGRRATVASADLPRFAEPLDQLRWDIERTWVDRVHPTDKPNFPLRPYAVGPSFLDSLERLEGISRDKVLSVVVDVLVGRPPGDTHPLRRSVGADDRPVTRGEAVCMRAPLQTGTPSARRLHYWKGSDGDIELSRVVLHDDVDP